MKNEARFKKMKGCDTTENRKIQNSEMKKMKIQTNEMGYARNKTRKINLKPPKVTKMTLIHDKKRNKLCGYFNTHKP